MFKEARHKKTIAFTLAELLIALTILGVIATFTIPKVLTAQQDQKSNAIAKEVAGTFANAYQAIILNGTASTATKPTDMTPYLNYVSYDTVSTIDNFPSAGTAVCSTVTPCLRLHNGAMLMLYPDTFGGSATTNAIFVMIDPDGIASNTKAVKFALYYNGKLTTRGNVLPNTQDGGGSTYSPSPSSDPTWFNWD